MTRNFLIYTYRMHYYATWATFVFIQVSVLIQFWRWTTVVSQDTFVWRKLWMYYKSTFIGKKFDRMLGNVSDPTLPPPSPSQPLRSKAYTLLCLLPSSLGNPSPWTLYLASIILSMVVTMYFWLWIDFLKWLYWQPARRV